jgi:3-oxoacyl-[acyl-carrier protein] reductase
MLMELMLKDKSALVTGGSRGIGRAIAHRLADEGCSVSICGRGAADLERALVDLRKGGARVHGMQADVTQPAELERFIHDSAEQLGGVDLLVANVGGVIGRGGIQLSLEDWRRTFELNFFHAVAVIQAALPYMRSRGGGSIAIIASISGWKPGPPMHYGAAKAAEIYLAGPLAMELAPDHIRVNTLSPGSLMFPGGGWERFRQRDPDAFARFEQREFPSRRLGTAEEVADVAVFLLSERARWINGAHIPVDGAQGRPGAF